MAARDFGTATYVLVFFPSDFISDKGHHR